VFSTFQKLTSKIKIKKKKERKKKIARAGLQQQPTWVPKTGCSYSIHVLLTLP